MGIESGSENAEAFAWRYVPLAIVVIAVLMMLIAIFVTGPRVSPGGSVASAVSPDSGPSLLERITAMPVAPGPPIFSLDVVDTAPGSRMVAAAQARTIVSVTPVQAITLLGWSIDGPAMKPNSSMYLEVDGKEIMPVLYGLKRPDVGVHFGSGALAASGFQVVIPPDRFGPGVHRVDLILVDAAGTAYRRASDRVEIHESH